MSYCPEDGVKMVPVEDDTAFGYVCYDCPDCQTHWSYDAEWGRYTAFMDTDNCTHNV